MENNRHVYLMADWEAAIRAVRAQISGVQQCLQPPPFHSRRSLEVPCFPSLQLPALCLPLDIAGSCCAWALLCTAGTCTGGHDHCLWFDMCLACSCCVEPTLSCHALHRDTPGLLPVLGLFSLLWLRCTLCGPALRIRTLPIPPCR